jgi:hypothetical protein
LHVRCFELCSWLNSIKPQVPEEQKQLSTTTNSQPANL